jgi:Ras GTPase-activating-like protein IQGAP2/3
MEAILGKEIGEITKLEEDLRNGIVLAQLAKHFEPSVVKKIYEAPNLQFRHSDNIVFFLAALRKLALPQVFYFETIDLYEKKNIPKVIYCIHALGYVLDAILMIKSSF